MYTEDTKWSGLYLETEFKRRLKLRVNVFCTFCVSSWPIAYYTNEKKTYFKKKKKKKKSVCNRYASNNVYLIYVQMKNKKFER